MRLLPGTPLAHLLGGYFLYTGILLQDEEEEDEEYSRRVVEDRDPINVIMVYLPSIIALQLLNSPPGSFQFTARFTLGESHSDRGLCAGTRLCQCHHSSGKRSRACQKA